MLDRQGSRAGPRASSDDFNITLYARPNLSKDEIKLINEKLKEVEDLRSLGLQDEDYVKRLFSERAKVALIERTNQTFVLYGPTCSGKSTMRRIALEQCSKFVDEYAAGAVATALTIKSFCIVPSISTVTKQNKVYAIKIIDGKISVTEKLSDANRVFIPPRMCMIKYVNNVEEKVARHCNVARATKANDNSSRVTWVHQVTISTFLLGVETSVEISVIDLPGLEHREVNDENGKDGIRETADISNMLNHFWKDCVATFEHPGSRVSHYEVDGFNDLINPAKTRISLVVCVGIKIFVDKASGSCEQATKGARRSLEKVFKNIKAVSDLHRDNKIVPRGVVPPPESTFFSSEVARYQKNQTASKWIRNWEAVANSLVTQPVTPKCNKGGNNELPSSIYKGGNGKVEPVEDMYHQLDTTDDSTPLSTLYSEGFNSGDSKSSRLLNALASWLDEAEAEAKTLYQIGLQSSASDAIVIYMAVLGLTGDDRFKVDVLSCLNEEARKVSRTFSLFNALDVISTHLSPILGAKWNNIQENAIKWFMAQLADDNTEPFEHALLSFLALAAYLKDFFSFSSFSDILAKKLAAAPLVELKSSSRSGGGGSDSQMVPRIVFPLSPSSELPIVKEGRKAEMKLNLLESPSPFLNCAQESVTVTHQQYPLSPVDERERRLDWLEQGGHDFSIRYHKGVVMAWRRIATHSIGEAILSEDEAREVRGAQFYRLVAHVSSLQAKLDGSNEPPYSVKPKNIRGLELHTKDLLLDKYDSIIPTETWPRMEGVSKIATAKSLSKSYGKVTEKSAKNIRGKVKAMLTKDDRFGQSMPRIFAINQLDAEHTYLILSLTQECWNQFDVQRLIKKLTPKEKSTLVDDLNDAKESVEKVWSGRACDLSTELKYESLLQTHEKVHDDSYGGTQPRTKMVFLPKKNSRDQSCVVLRFIDHESLKHLRGDPGVKEWAVYVFNGCFAKMEAFRNQFLCVYESGFVSGAPTSQSQSCLFVKVEAGTDLETYLEVLYCQGEANIEELAALNTQVIEACCAHSLLGIYHRDLKLSNFVVIRCKDGIKVVSIDFDTCVTGNDIGLSVLHNVTTTVCLAPDICFGPSILPGVQGGDGFAIGLINLHFCLKKEPYMYVLDIIKEKHSIHSHKKAREEFKTGLIKHWNEKVFHMSMMSEDDMKECAEFAWAYLVLTWDLGYLEFMNEKRWLPLDQIVNKEALEDDADYCSLFALKNIFPEEEVFQNEAKFQLLTLSLHPDPTYRPKPFEWLHLG